MSDPSQQPGACSPATLVEAIHAAVCDKFRHVAGAWDVVCTVLEKHLAPMVDEREAALRSQLAAAEERVERLRGLVERWLQPNETSVGLATLIKESREAVK
jgi:hypothetical protein